MADVNKTVEIALKVIGAESASGLTTVVTLFKNLKTAADTAKESVTKLQGALDGIKAPPSLDGLVTSMTKLGSVKIANLNTMAIGLQKLTTMGTPPDLSAFVKELNTFSKIKLPSVTSFFNGFQKLSTMGTPPSLQAFVTELTAFSKIKLPSVTSIANGFNKLSAIGTLPNLTPFVTELQKFSAIKLPSVTAIATGFQKLISLDVTAVINRIRLLNDALAALDKRGGINTFKTFAADISNMGTAFASVEKSVNKIKTSLETVGQAATDSGLRIKTFSDKVKTVLQFRLISAGLLALRDSFTDGITTIMEYDQSLKDLQAITGATASEVSMMGTTIRDVASKTKFSASEVAEGMKIIGQAGFSAAEAVQTMQAVSDLATGTLSSMATSVDLVTTAMRVFRIDASESSMVADVFANAVNRSKLTIDKLRTAMNYVGPIARDAGVTFKETAAAMGTLANSGLRASTIGTGLRNIFAGLISPSKKLRAAAAEAGVALEDLDTRSNTLPSVLANLSLVIKDSSTALEVFGKRGASAALALTSAGSQFQIMLDTVGESGTAAAQAAIQMEGLGVSFKNLKDKIGLLAVALGDAGLTQILKGLIDISRLLVDVLINVTENGFGKFILVSATMVASILAIEAAISGLSAAFGILTAAMSTSVIAPVIGALVASFESLLLIGGSVVATLGGPLAAALLAIGLGLAYVYGFMGKASKSATVMASEFDSLGKELEAYSVKVAGLKKDSNDLKEANTALRTKLFETANAYIQVSEEARAAAYAINPLTGELTDGGIALDAYNKKLGELELNNLKNAADQANKSLEESGTFWNRWINKMVADAKSLGTNLTFAPMANEMLDFSKRIHDGDVSLEEMQKTIANWDSTNLIEEQKAIVSQYKNIMTEADKWTKHLQDENLIGLDDSLGNIEQAAKDAGVFGKVLEGVMLQVKALKEANKDTFTNIIEKWAVDGTESISKMVDEYKALGGAMSDAEENAIRSTIARQNYLIKEQKSLRDAAVLEAKSATDKKAVWTKYYADLAPLLDEADAIQRQLSENGTYQRIKALGKESDALQKSLDQNAAKYKKNAELVAKYQAEATRKYEANRDKLLAGEFIDPAAQEAEYESFLQHRKTLYSQYLLELSKERATGTIDETEYNNKKMESEIAFYEESLKNARKYFDQLGEEYKGSKDYEKREQALESSEKKLAEIRAKYYEQNIKQTQEAFEAQETFVKKKEELETEYAEKVVSINEEKNKALADLDASILANKKSLALELQGIESSGADKIRAIQQRTMSDSQKAASDLKAAAQKLSEGTALIAEAGRENDKEKLATGVALIKQYESLASGSKNVAIATGAVTKAQELYKRAADLKSTIAQREDEKKKIDIVAKATKELNALKVDYNAKVTDAKDAYEKIAKAADATHLNNMSNYAKEKIADNELTVQKLENLQKISPEEGRNEAIKAIEDENKALGSKLKVIDSIKQATLDSISKTKESADSTSKAWEESNKKFMSTYDEVSGVWSYYEESAVSSLGAVDKAWEESNKKFMRTFDEVKGIWVPYEESANESLGKVTDAAKESVKGVAEIIDSSSKDTKLLDTDAIIAEWTEANGIVKDAVTDISDVVKQADTEIIIEPKVSDPEVVPSLKASITELVSTAKVIFLDIQIPALELFMEFKANWEALKDKTITLTTINKSKSVGEVDTEDSGNGIFALAGGGKIPGFGGGDKNHALLENGEWVINKYAVKKFGDSFMSSINNMRLPKFRNGGKVGNVKDTFFNKNDTSNVVNNWSLRIDTKTHAPKGRVTSIAEQLITEVRGIY